MIRMYDDELKNVRKLMSSKDWENALMEIDNILDKDLNNFILSEILNQKAICLFNLNEFEESLECFNQSWDLDDYFIDYKLYDKAYFEVYGKKIKKSYFLALYQKYDDLKDDKNALFYFKKVYNANSDNEYFLKEYSELAANFQKTSANKYYVRSDDLDEIKVSCKYFYNSGDYDNALKYADMALDIDKDALDDIFYNCISNRKPSDVLYKRYIQESHRSFNDILNKKFSSDEEYKEIYDKLIFHLSKAIEINFDAILIEGFMLNSIKDFENAEKEFDIYLLRDKYSRIALIGKIQSLIGQKKFSELLIYYEDVGDKSHILWGLQLKDRKSLNFIRQNINKFFSEDEMLVKGLRYASSLNFEKAIEEYDKLENDYNLKSELLFALHKNVQAINSISEETSAIIKFKDYCYGKINTGYFGVFKSSLKNYNWEYAYIESGLFKRLMSTTLEELKFNAISRGLIWGIINSEIASKTNDENKILMLSDFELIYEFGENYNEIALPPIKSGDSRIMAYIHCLNGEYTKAIAEYDKCEVDQIVLNNKGYAFLKLNEFDEALNCFNEGLKIDADDKYLQFNRTFTYLIKGDYSKAKESFKNYKLLIDYEFDDELRNYLFDLGRVLLDKNQFEDSIDCFDMCITVDSKRSYYWNFKANALCYLKNYDEALKNYDEALNLESNDNVFLYNKAHCLYDMGDFNQSLDVINESLSSEYNYPDSWNLKGRVLEKLSDFDGAFKCYEKSLEIGANANEYHFLDLISLLVNCERFEEALKYCDELLKIDSDNEFGLYFKETCLNELNSPH